MLTAPYLCAKRAFLNASGKTMQPLRSRYSAQKAVLLMSAAALLVLLCLPYDADALHLANYVIDGIGLLIVLGVLVFRFAAGALDMFEPLVYCSVIYGAIFFFMPMYDICTDQTLWFGYDFYKYGITATIYAILGYLTFVAMYCKKWIKRSRKTWQRGKSQSVLSKYAVYVIVIMYVISLLAKLYYLTSISGNSLTYILTFGLFGDAGADKLEAKIGFVNMFSYCLPASVLLYLTYGKSNAMKVIFIYLMVMTQMADGFRFIIVETAFMLCAFYYLKRAKRPSLISVAIVLCALLIPIFMMTLFRESVRSGTGVDVSVLSSSDIAMVFDDAIFDNLRIYNNYYGLIGVVPNLFPYQYLNMIVVRTILMIVPQAIWPNKYDGFVSPGIEVYYGGAFLGTGQAYPNLGEFYLAFDVLGIVVFMGLFGLWMGYLRQKLMYSNNPIDLIMYVSIVANCLQIIIRGYTPSNFWLVVFSALPVLLFRFACMKRIPINTRGNK